MQSMPDQSDLLASVKGFGLTISQILQETLKVIQLETRLAGISLFSIILMLFVASMLCLAIWLSLMLAIGVWLVQLGINWAVVFLLIAGANLLLLLAVGWGIKLCGKNLQFKATRRQLKANPFSKQGQSHAEPEEANPNL